MSENTKIAKKPIEDQPITNEKLPYVKPELHFLDLESTEGKSPSSPTETTIGSFVKVGPS